MPLPNFNAGPGELVILSLLAEGPKYGYALTKEVGLRSDGKLRLTPGVLYPLLKQMEGDGLIASSWETVRSDRADDDRSHADDESASRRAHSPAGADDTGGGGSGGGRKRKWYRLSAKGKKRLAQGVAAHHAYRAVIDLFIPGGPSDGKETAR